MSTVLEWVVLKTMYYSQTSSVEKGAEQILQSVYSAVVRWPNATMERIQSGRKTEFEDPLEGTKAAIKNSLLLAHPVLKKLLIETIQQFPAIEAMSHHVSVLMINCDIELFLDVVFELVCEALGLFLPAKKFRESLPLIINPSEDPAIGICRQDWPSRNANLSRDESASSRVTICRDDMVPGSGGTVLEAVKVDSAGEPFTTYMGVGIWVPQVVTPWEDVGGMMVKNGEMRNASLT